MVRGIGKVIDKDMGWKMLMKKLDEVSEGIFVRIGIVGEALNTERKSGDAATNLEIGTAHEFGTETIPERSHIRAAADENQRKYERTIEALFRKATKTKDDVKKLNWALAMGRVGALVLSDIKRKIQSGIPPTLKHREGTPLIDTGQYINSLQWEVRKKGASVKEGKK
jgi:hypothetical protein